MLSTSNDSIDIIKSQVEEIDQQVLNPLNESIDQASNSQQYYASFKNDILDFKKKTKKLLNDTKDDIFKSIEEGNPFKIVDSTINGIDSIVDSFSSFYKDMKEKHPIETAIITGIVIAGLTALAAWAAPIMPFVQEVGTLALKAYGTGKAISNFHQNIQNISDKSDQVADKVDQLDPSIKNPQTQEMSDALRTQKEDERKVSGSKIKDQQVQKFSDKFNSQQKSKVQTYDQKEIEKEYKAAISQVLSPEIGVGFISRLHDDIKNVLKNKQQEELLNDKFNNYCVDITKEEPNIKKVILFGEMLNNMNQYAKKIPDQNKRQEIQDAIYAGGKLVTDVEKSVNKMNEATRGKFSVTNVTRYEILKTSLSLSHPELQR